MVPCRFILTIGDGNNNYDIDDFAADNNLVKEEKKLLNKLKSKIFDATVINYYEVENSNPDEAVNIFVRINSGGTTLSFSNILMSIAIAGWQKKDARTEINQLIDMINNKGFAIDNDYVLKAFLYLFHNDVRFRIKSFDNAFVSLIEEKWDSIRNCIDELFELMRSYGLDRSSLTSNNATLPILYYLYHRNIYMGFSTSIAYQNERVNIRVWLMKTLVFQSFGRSGDRILQLARKAYTEDINNSYINPEVSQFPAEQISSNIKQPETLTDEFIDSNLLSIHKDNKYAFALLSLIYSNLDYRNTFHKDHIHPYVLCQKAGLDWNEYDSILNLQMLDANENMSKNAKPLKQWVEDETTFETKDSFLKTHIIPNVDLELDNFEEYIAERRLLLHKKIRQIFDNGNLVKFQEEMDDSFNDGQFSDSFEDHE